MDTNPPKRTSGPPTGFKAYPYLYGCHMSKPTHDPWPDWERDCELADAMGTTLSDFRRTVRDEP